MNASAGTGMVYNFGPSDSAVIKTANPGSVAPSAISENQKLGMSLTVDAAPHVQPPSLDVVDGKLSRVAARADKYGSVILIHIIHSVGDRNSLGI